MDLLLPLTTTTFLSSLGGMKSPALVTLDPVCVGRGHREDSSCAALPGPSHACLVSQPSSLAQDLSPRPGAGDHVMALGNHLLLAVSWEERKGRKEKQLVRSSTRAKKIYFPPSPQKKGEIKGKDESEEQLWVRSGDFCQAVLCSRTLWCLLGDSWV